MTDDQDSGKIIDPIEELLSTCLEQPESQWSAAVDALCSEQPTLAARIRKRFEFLRQVGFHLPGLEDTPDQGNFGEFRLLERIGRGGMGVVYRAEQTSLGRTVALKCIRADYLEMPKAKARFRREVDALSALDHPAICTVYEAGEVDGRPYVAMRYVQGRNLAEIIAEQQERAKETGDHSHATNRDDQFALLAQFETVARALHTAHEAGLIHRDIKPANIMITLEGDPVLLDFGLVRSEEEEEQTLTQTGDALGTPAYMAPEQIDTHGRDLDRRCDIYSLATTLYECLTHEPPFRGATRDELYRAILTQGTPDSRSANAMISNDLATVLRQAMQRERTDRYSTALEFAEELRRIRHFEPIKTQAASLSLRLRRWAQREPVKAILAAVLVIAIPTVTGLGGYVFAKSDVIEAGEVTQRKLQLENLLAAGYYHRDLHATKEAKKCFTSALELDPMDRDAKLGLSLTQATEQAPEDEWSDDPADQFHLGLIATNAGQSADNHERAFQHFQRAILLSGTPRLSHMMALGHAARRAGRVDTVRTCLAAIQRHWPDDEYGQRAAARLAIEIEPELTVKLITNLLAKNSALVELHTIRGHAHQSAGRTEAAYADYMRGVDATPDNIRVVHPLAEFLFKDHRYPEIVTLYERAIAGGLSDLGAYGHLASVLNAMGRREDASKYYDKVLELTPTNAYDYCYLGDAHRTKKANKKAEAAYMKGLSLDPSIKIFHQRLAQIYRSRRDIGAYVKALEAMTQDAEAINRADAHYNLANYKGSRGQYLEAERHFATALEIRPDLPEAHCNLANSLALRYRIPEALAHYEEGHELSKKEPKWKYNSAGWVEKTRKKLPDHKRYVDYSNGIEIEIRDEKDRTELAHHLLHHGHYLQAFDQFSILMSDGGKASNSVFDRGHAALAALGLGFGLDGTENEAGEEELAEAREVGREWLDTTLSQLSAAAKSGSRGSRSTAMRRLVTMSNRPELEACRDSARLALLGFEEREAMQALLAEFDSALPR